MQSHFTNPAIQKAVEELERLSADQEVRRIAEARAKALRDKSWMLSASRREGFEEGEQKGRQEGELIGQIRTLQHALRRPVSSRDDLSVLSLMELQALAKSLEAELN